MAAPLVECVPNFSEGRDPTTLDGSPDVLQHGSVIAGNPTLHKWLMDSVRNA